MSEKSIRTSGCKARQYVQSLTPFHNSGTNNRHPKGSTLWGEWLTFAWVPLITSRNGTQHPVHPVHWERSPSDSDPLYVVYSYGKHWPLLANWKGIWFANTEKSTRTTNRHKGYVNPGPAVPLDCAGMRCLIEYAMSPEHIDMAAQMKLLPDERLIAAASAIRIGGVKL